MSDQSPQLVVVGGPNGAGKSTLAPILLRGRLGIGHFVNADVIAQGLSAFRPESVAIEAGRIMLARLHALAAGGENFAFETTLATRSYAPWIRTLLAEGYDFHLVFCALESPDLAVARVASRVLAGGHAVPEADIRRRYHRGICNFFELYQPLAKTWRVYNGSLASPRLAARGGLSRKLFVQDAMLWDKLRVEASV